MQNTTRDVDAILKAVANILNKNNPDLDLNTLFDCIRFLPLCTNIKYDKIFGRWIFSNTDEDDWPIGCPAEFYAGPSFCFIDHTPEMAIGRGIYYYFHLREI